MGRELEDYKRKYARVLSRVVRRPELSVEILRQVDRVLPCSFRKLADEAMDVGFKNMPDERLADFQAAIQSLEPQLRQAYFEFLTPNDPLEQAGAIFLYGSAGTARPRRAAEVYQQAPGPVLVTDADPEVQQRFSETLLARGVSAADIWPEPQARNYLENADYCWRLLQSREYQPDIVYVVSESLMARRAVIATACFAPAGLRIASVPMIIDQEHQATDPTRPDNWFQSQLGCRIAMQETVKLYIYEALGLVKLV